MDEKKNKQGSFLYKTEDERDGKGCNICVYVNVSEKVSKGIVTQKYKTQ